jgi:hypothetical protein
MTCIHCGRSIVLDVDVWVDPEATGDDAVWRETCDAHDTFTAEHEPALTDAQRRALVVLLSAPETGLRTGNRSYGNRVHGGVVRSLETLGLTQYVHRPREWLTFRYRLTDAGRRVAEDCCE